MHYHKQEKFQPFAGGGKLLLGLVGLFGVVALYRLAMGLGASTNLNDTYPWGLWIAMDVMVGVALAAGGFAIAAAVYVLNLKKYKPVVRPAILTAYFGYLMVSVGILLDIGKPHVLWHGLVMWQPHSVMFEVIMCVVMYLTVLTFEFAPFLLEGIGKTELAKKLHGPAILFPLVIFGITLSFFHQSSLGAMFLIVPTKLSHLWWTTVLPYNFYLSCIAAGLAMVSCEGYLAARFFKHEAELDIMQGLAKGTTIALLAYLAMRLGDLVAKGNLALAFDGSTTATLFLIEVVGGAVLPMILLALPSIRRSAGRIAAAQALVIGGVILNRFNVNFLTQARGGSSYFPSWMEIVITVGLIAAIMLLYRAAVIKLPIFSQAEEKDR